MCSTRRYGHSCGRPITRALDLEAQLVDWIRAFQPDGELLDLLLETLRAKAGEHTEQSKLLLSLFEQVWVHEGR